MWIKIADTSTLGYVYKVRVLGIRDRWRKQRNQPAWGLDLFTRANIAENDPTKKFLVPQK